MVLLTATWAPDRLTPFRRWLAAHGGTLSWPLSAVQSQHFSKSHKALLLSTSSQAANLLTFLQIPWRGTHLHSSARTLASPGNYTGDLFPSLGLATWSLFLNWPRIWWWLGRVGHIFPHSSSVTYVSCVPPHPTQEWGWICHNQGYG